MSGWGSFVTDLASTAGGGLISSYLSPSMGQAETAVDPNAPYRSSYASQLYNLTQNPQDIMNLPGMQYQYNLGLDAMDRKLAAAGENLSPAERIAQQQYGQSFAGQNYMNYLNSLYQLSQPTPAASIMAGSYIQNQQGFAGNIGNIFSQGISSGLGSWLNPKK